jgi:CBS domain-containing protein
VAQGRGKKVVETFSATDLRDCPVAQLRSWLGTTVTEFKKKVAEYRRDGSKPLDAATGDQATGDGGNTNTAVDAGTGNEEDLPRPREMVTCSFESTLGEVIEKAASRHVHRLWVVDGGEEEEDGVLRGVVSLTDVLRVVREAFLQI